MQVRNACAPLAHTCAPPAHMCAPLALSGAAAAPPLPPRRILADTLGTCGANGRFLETPPPPLRILAEPPGRPLGRRES